MLELTRWLGFSETAFLLEPSTSDAVRALLGRAGRVTITGDRSSVLGWATCIRARVV
jgi:hypothetical protein